MKEAGINNSIQNSKNEIDHLRKTIQEMAKDDETTGQKDDMMILYGRLQYQIQNFETKLSEKFDSVMSLPKGGNLGQETKTTLPSLSSTLKKEKFQGLSKFDKRKSVSSNTSEKLTDMLSKKNQQYSQKMIRDRFQLESLSVSNDSKMEQGNRLNEKIKGMKKGRQSISEPNKILSKELRNNPFADPPPINENDLRKGVLLLINKGMIPKDVDLTPAFERGVPPLSRKNVTLHPGSEKYIKGLTPAKAEGFLSAPPDFNTFITNQGSLESSKTNSKANKSKSERESQQDPSKQIGEKKSVSKSPDTAKSKEKVKTVEEKLKNHKMLMRAYLGYDHSNEITFTSFKLDVNNGMVDTESSQYLAFKNSFYISWGAIVTILEKLEKFLALYGIKKCELDGNKIAAFALLLKKPTKRTFLEFLLNKEIIEEVVSSPSKMYRGPHGKELASLKIQSTWRMHVIRKGYDHTKSVVTKVKVIQSQIKIFLYFKSIQKFIKKKKSDKYVRYYEMDKKFQENWPQIKASKRVEIHINGWAREEFVRLTMEKYNQRSNAQITRIFGLSDPNLEIIYIVPFELPSELINYYSKILELGEVENYQERLHFIWPECFHKFPSHTSTSRLLLYSSSALKKIKKIIQGKNAYIVNGFPCVEDIDLAIRLDIPLFNGNPEKSKIVSTKAGSIAMLKSLDIPTPPSRGKFKNEKEILRALAELTFDNKTIMTWVFKIEEEFNGRGIATLNLETVKIVNQIRENKALPRENALISIEEILANLVPLKLKMACPTLYSNYEEYIYYFIHKGGIIEASPPGVRVSQINSPSVFFLIEPTGSITVLGTYDKIAAEDYINIGCMSPQRSVPSLNVHGICSLLGKKLFEMGIYGFITLDLIAFPDFNGSPKAHPLFWAIGVDCFLNDFNSVFFYFDFLMRGRVDQASGLYFLDSKHPSEIHTQQHQTSVSNIAHSKDISTEKYFMYCPYLYHPNLYSISYQSFFHVCRIESLTFDLEKKSGATFILVDSFAKNVLSLLTIGDNKRSSIKFMTDSLNFLLQQAGSSLIKNQDPSGTKTTRVDQIYLIDIINKIRMLNKNQDRLTRFSIERMGGERKSMIV